jgi:hypothetical protein
MLPKPAAFKLGQTKKQAAQGEASSGLVGKVLRGGGIQELVYIEEGLFCPVVGAVAG